MSIPESKLSTWLNQGATVTAKSTHEQVRQSINAHTFPVQPRVFLQGSYVNYTNIRGDSDVDIVVEYPWTYCDDLSDLSEHDRATYGNYHQTATYRWGDYHGDVYSALVNRFGYSSVTPGKKCLKLAKEKGRLAADVVVCFTSRKFVSFPEIGKEDYLQGIAIFVVNESKWVVNYPAQHKKNGQNKNSVERTGRNYKPTIRMFKNAKKHLVDEGEIGSKDAPSYFIEGLLYNVPDEFYCTSSLQDRYKGILAWLIHNMDQFDDLKCQNQISPLFGTSSTTWNVEPAKKLIEKYAEMWKNW
ncbi:MAG: nucleotidyltransferase [Chloroflexota bacterium]